MLGFGPCYHMVELLAEPSHVRLWQRAYAGEAVDFEEVFDGFRATTDFPAYPLYKPLLARYPSARFILTTRDPARWYDSASSTIFQAGPTIGEFLKIGLQMPFSEPLRRTVDVFKLTDTLFKREFDGRLKDRAHVMARFEAHNAAVRAAIPAEQLLEFEVKDGWGPLCAFLDKPVPDVPFPRTNSHDAWWSKRKKGPASLLGKAPQRADPLE